MDIFKMQSRHAAASAALGLLAFLALSPAPAAARSGDAPPEARSLLGSYLAGRIARGQHDSAAASEYYQRALERDPKNEALIEQALLMDTTEGRFDRGLLLAKRLNEAQPSHRMARMMLGLAEAKAGNFVAASDHFKVSGNGVMGELTSALARAWMMSAKGDVKEAGEILDNIKQADWAQFYLRYHKALIMDVAGRRQEARAIYERIFRNDAKSLRIALAYAHHAAFSGDAKLAKTIIDEHIKKTGGTPHPVIRAFADTLKANEPVNLLIQTPVEGVSEVFYGLGEALSSEGGISVGAVYLQMALYLNGESPFVLAALANVHETTKKYEAAIGSYDRIAKGSPLHGAIEIRKALNLNQLERVDEAQKILDQLMRDDPKDLRPLDALGNVMRGRKRYDEAIEYYTRAIGVIGARPEKKHWSYYYARGTCYERVKKWPQAEADLQKAMQLSPDQPLVLNYLGYSWVDQSKNLKQGLALIERAVQLKPDDGYIVDSLGWAHFRLGNFKEAAKYLERAVELKPEDPVLNDHLGDAFWRVGRQIEARFQWEQALTLKPEPEDADKIKGKLLKGLPEQAQVRSVKKAREAARPEAPRKRTETKLQRPVVE